MENKFQIADYIIHKLNGQITHLKLQKLLYYIYVWSLVNGKKISNCSFVAWKLGPVETDIYEKYKYHGKNLIPVHSDIKIDFFDSEDKKLIDFVLDSYSPFSAFDLSETTHSENPWKLTPINEIISDELIYSYYSENVYAKNFPISDNKPFIVPITNSTKSFSFDMESLFIPVFPSIQEYKKVMSESADKSLILEFMALMNE